MPPADTTPTPTPAPAPGRRRRDAARNEQALLEAAARVFATSGVDAPVREVAGAAGVGVATVYRHFPTRSDLVAAVYRHQIDRCAQAGPALLASAASPFAALTAWVDGYVDFLGTKHGLAKVWEGDEAGFTTLHRSFLTRLCPVLEELLEAGRTCGEIVAPVTAHQVLRAIGDLVAWSTPDPDYDVATSVGLLLAGLRQPPFRDRPGPPPA